MAENTNNINQQNQIPKNLPKKLPPNLKKLDSGAGLPPKLPNKLPSNMQRHLQPQSQVPPQPQREKSLEELLSRKQTATVLVDESPATKISYKSDKQLVNEYKKNVAQAKKLIKKLKKPIIKGDIQYHIIENIFNTDTPDVLYFYKHCKVRKLLNQNDAAITITTTPSHKSIATTLIIILLIVAIIASGIYVAYILTRNMGQKGTEVDGDIGLYFDEPVATQRMDITNARLNTDLPVKVKPTIKNNTNARLYVRFFVKLDYELYQYYTPENKIEDLSVSCNADSEEWWLDSTTGMAYYLKILEPNQTETLFDTFQINADPSLEGVWSGRRLVATIQVEVFQVIADGQELPPGWSVYWYSMMVS